MDELTKKKEMEDKKSARRAPHIFHQRGHPSPRTEDADATLGTERENTWTCSDFLFQTYPFGLQRWEGKKQ